MDVYKTEEEQVQAIKQWWKDNSSSLIVGIVMGVVIIGGYQYWSDYKQSKSQQASVIYSKILSATEDNTENTALLKSDYAGTPYAALAGLLLAKDELNNNEVEQAISQLKWVVDNSNDDGITHIARQRLARVYLSENKVELADALVKAIKSQGFEAGYSEIRGDINLAKKLPVQAKENYRLALSAMTQADQRYAVVKMKLDDLTQATVNTSTGVISK